MQTPSFVYLTPFLEKDGTSIIAQVQKHVDIQGSVPFPLFSPTLCFQPPTLETEFISCRRWPLWKWRRPDISDMLWWFSPPSLWQTNILTVSVVFYLTEMDKHWSQSSDQIMEKKTQQHCFITRMHISNSLGFRKCCHMEGRKSGIFVHM